MTERSRTIDYVLPEDGDVVVPVAAGVFVVESQSVQQLVLDDAVTDAAKTLQRHRLLLPNAAHRGEAAGGGNGDGEGIIEGVRLHRETWLILLPMSRPKAQVHPLLLSWLEADAGLVVKILHGRQNGVLLLIICNGTSGWSYQSPWKRIPFR